MVQIKNILDTVDGHLARARNTPSRIGRFLDSITDYITNLAFFIAIGWNLTNDHSSTEIWVLSIVAFLSSQLQCSYYVFYTISYMENKKKSTESRVNESIKEEDHEVYDDPFRQKCLIILQKIFLILYGWQDNVMMIFDKWCLKYFDKCPASWYLDRKLLTITSWFGLGMHLFFITLFAMLNQFYACLWFFIIVGNLCWLFLIFYRINYFRTER